MIKRDIKKDPFDEYIKNLPPTRKELGQAWSTAIGLQDVDGLKPSKYLYETTEFLEKFLRNLLLDEKNELHNREMHVSGNFLLCHDDPINDPINDPIKLVEREKMIVELLRAEPSLTRSEMADRLNCSDSTVKRALQSMVGKGVIKCIESNKKGEWIILEEIRGL